MSHKTEQLNVFISFFVSYLRQLHIKVKKKVVRQQLQLESMNIKVM